MNLRQMECFLAVADELHFRRAADRLRLAPASVSEAVAALERSLGAQLVERTSRRVRLTPVGAEFAASIRPPIEALQRAHRSVRLHSLRERDLVVAHTPELGRLLLPGLVGASSGDADALPSWRPVAMHTPEQLAAVAEGEVDIGLCWSVPEQPGIASVVLGEFPMVAVLWAGDALADHRQLSLTQLRSRHILITPREDNPYIASQFDADTTRVGIPPTSIEEVDRYDELVMHVAARRHVGVHPGPIALASPLSSVVFRPIADLRDTVRICAISHANARSQPVAAFVTQLRSIVDALDVAGALS